jgi:membrane associated rhomboid family serine protease
MHRLSAWFRGLPYRSGGYLTPVNTAVMLFLAVSYVAHLSAFLVSDLVVLDACALDPTAVLAGQVWRVATAAILHLDPWHLILVLIGLFCFGRALEERLGSRGYTIFVLAGMVAANAITVLASFLLLKGGAFALPVMDRRVHGFGGVVMALLAAFATLTPNATVLLVIVPVRAWILAASAVAINLIYLLFRLKAAADPAWLLMTLGGAAFGFGAMRSSAWWGHCRRRIGGWLERRRHARDEDDQRELDRLLAKVSAQGLPSLTSGEKRFLEHYRSTQRGRQP